MDERLRTVVLEKIAGITGGAGDILHIAESLKRPSGEDSFVYGVAVGRLYNSFHYQCRRILGRDPTQAEFNEFLRILAEHEADIIRSLAQHRA